MVITHIRGYAAFNALIASGEKLFNPLGTLGSTSPICFSSLVGTCPYSCVLNTQEYN